MSRSRPELPIAFASIAALTGAAAAAGLAAPKRPARPAAAGLAARKPVAAKPAPVEYNRDIRPILSDNCFACHGPDRAKRMAGLRLDVREDAVARKALVPGKPEKSSLIARVFAPAQGIMPPVASHKKLTRAQKELLKRWVAQGAKYEVHWAYLPPRAAPPPAVKDARWPLGLVDRFILAKIEAAGMKPAPEADPVVLIRRLSFDLTGLPPTPAEVDQFVKEYTAESTPTGGPSATPTPLPSAQTSIPHTGGLTPTAHRLTPNAHRQTPTALRPPPNAYLRLVDRLLASPRFGERMATYWLDLVRYADTVGYHGDQEHHISPYRDWVIKAFNDNMPFDRFTAEQLAGDLMPDATESQRIATGYNRLLQTTHEGGAQDREYLAKYAADRIRSFSGVWLGATLGCAECHDHKYDPYSQKEFYSLSAFFADIEERGAYKGPDANPTKRPPEIEVLSPFDREEADRLKARIEQLEARAAQTGTAADPKELAELRQRYDDLLKRKRLTMVTVSVPPRIVRVLRRGDWMDDGGEVVQPAVPGFLPPLPVKDRRATRLDLARWLTAPDHPLTARVWVNRTWYLLFGAGLCRSLDDFGAQGEPPTHPELLDYLALDFVRSGWDVKRLIKTLVLSRAYRQSSALAPALRGRDPENRLFARQGRFRLPAEMVRDNALAVSGLLVEKLGGPSARPYQPEGYYALLNFPKRTYQHDTGEGQWRRGVYVHWQRQYVHPMLKAFDAPSREECTAQRPITNTPLAALALLNDPSFVEAARVLAARVMREGGTSETGRIRWAWRQVLSREPTGAEAAALDRLHRKSLAEYQADPEAAKQVASAGLAPKATELRPAELAAWTAVARALLNLNETITRE